MALKLPTDPGPTADFYDTIRYLQKAVSFLMEQATAAAFNQKAHAMTTADFQGSLDRNTAATAANTAASTAEIAQLVDITARLTTALDALTTSQAPTQAQLDQINAASDALEAATAALTADDTAVIPPAGAPADTSGNVPSA